jgi:hypothetical protein
MKPLLRISIYFIILCSILFPVDALSSDIIYIVVADKTQEAEDFAIKELAEYLEKITNDDPKIIQESSWSGKTKAIFIGATNKRKSLFDAVLPPEGYVIKSTDEGLFLYGDDTKGDPLNMDTRVGTLFAVYDYLYRAYGVKWLWPGESGEFLIRNQKLKIDGFNVKESPAFRQRKFRNVYSIEKITKIAVDNLQVSQDYIQNKRKELDLWLRRNRAGMSISIVANHAFTDWYNRYSKTHPEWFAVQKNGKRFWPENKAHLKFHISDPAFIDEAYKQGVNNLKSSPNQVISFSAAENDGGWLGFCMEEKCKSWDSPKGAKIELIGPEGFFDYVSLTDRYVKFWNILAERLKKTFPDKYIGALAYCATERPPVETVPAENLIIGIVPGPNIYLNDKLRSEHLEYLEGWAKLPNKIFVRPNVLYAGRGFPLNYSRKLMSDLRLFYKKKSLGLDYDSLIGHWGTNGLNYYILLRGSWNPEVDYESILNDYCDGFGDAKRIVKQYFLELERITETMAKIDQTKKPWAWKREEEIRLLSTFSDKVIKELEALINKGISETKSKDTKDKLNVLFDGLKITRLQIENKLFGIKAFNDSAILEHLKKMYPGALSVNIPYLYYFYYSKHSKKVSE